MSSNADPAGMESGQSATKSTPASSRCFTTICRSRLEPDGASRGSTRTKIWPGVSRRKEPDSPAEATHAFA